jgi:hypothetical protein
MHTPNHKEGQMATSKRSTKSTKSTRKSTRKPAQRKRNEHSSVVSEIASQVGTSPRRVRRIARKLGLGSERGRAYTLSAAQQKKLVKALS